MNNDLTVIWASNVPIDRCAPKLTLSGLAGTMTGSSTAFDVNIEKPASGAITGTFSQAGVLAFDGCPGGQCVVPSTSCAVFQFKFLLMNQMTPRAAAAAVSIEMNGRYGFKLAPANNTLTVPSTLTQWYASLMTATGESMTLTAGNAQTDPLFVLTPAFTTKKMGQTNPWPGAR